MSTGHSWSGLCAMKWRCTRSSGIGGPGSPPRFPVFTIADALLAGHMTARLYDQPSGTPLSCFISEEAITNLHVVLVGVTRGVSMLLPKFLRFPDWSTQPPAVGGREQASMPNTTTGQEFHQERAHFHRLKPFPGMLLRHIGQGTPQSYRFVLEESDVIVRLTKLHRLSSRNSRFQNAVNVGLLRPSRQREHLSNVASELHHISGRHGHHPHSQPNGLATSGVT